MSKIVKDTMRSRNGIGFGIRVEHVGKEWHRASLFTIRCVRQTRMEQNDRRRAISRLFQEVI